jgi:hypothetical protein
VYMRRRMIVVVHADDDTKEPRYLRHPHAFRAKQRATAFQPNATPSILNNCRKESIGRNRKYRLACRPVTPMPFAHSESSNPRHATMARLRMSSIFPRSVISRSVRRMLTRISHQTGSKCALRASARPTYVGLAQG